MNENEKQKNTETVLARLEQLRLSDSETASMRSRLHAYTATSGILSPLTSFTVFSGIRSYISSYPRIASGLAFIVILLIGSTGITFASQNALPGDALYPVKISLVEPIQGAFIFTPLGQAQWQTELASRRLSEAVALATQNTLSTSTQAYLATAATVHVAQAETDANQLAASGDTKDAVSVRTNLEANLTAHAEFLALITPQLAAEGEATTTDAVFALLTKVQEDRAQVEGTNTVPGLPSLTLGSTTVADSALMSAGNSSSTELNLTASTSVAMQVQLQQDEEALATILSQNPSLLKGATEALTASSTTGSSTNYAIASTSDAHIRAAAIRVLITEMSSTTIPDTIGQ